MVHLFPSSLGNNFSQIFNFSRKYNKNNESSNIFNDLLHLILRNLEYNRNMLDLQSNETNASSSSSYCLKLNLIGVFLSFVFIAGLFFNSVLLWAFYLKKELLKIGSNILVATMAINNLFAIVFELPIVIINAFYCK